VGELYLLVDKSLSVFSNMETTGVINKNPAKYNAVETCPKKI
jgi:hypothetical protein